MMIQINNYPPPPEAGMTDFHYPPLDTKTLQGVEVARQLMAEHPSYFLTAPYTGDVELLLKKWFDPAALRGRRLEQERADDEAKGGVTMQDDKWAYLYQETSELYAGLKNEKYTSEEGDRMAYFKTMAGLQEKMISLQERALGMKQISEHYKFMMQIMEKVFTPEQRNQFMAELKQSMGQ